MWQQQRTITQIKFERGISFGEAKQIAAQQTTLPIGNQTYSSAATRSPKCTKQLADCASQTMYTWLGPEEAPTKMDALSFSAANTSSNPVCRASCGVQTDAPSAGATSQPKPPEPPKPSSPQKAPGKATAAPKTPQPVQPQDANVAKNKIPPALTTTSNKNSKAKLGVAGKSKKKEKDPLSNRFTPLADCMDVLTDEGEDELIGFIQTLS